MGEDQRGAVSCRNLLRVRGQGRILRVQRAGNVRRVAAPAGCPSIPHIQQLLRGRIRNRWDKTGRTMEIWVKAGAGRSESPRRGRICRWSTFCFEESVQLFGELVTVQLGGSFSGNEHQIRLGRHLVPIQSEVFPEPPLDPISSASCPRFPADGHSQPRSAQRVFQHPDVEMGGAAPGAFVSDPPIFGGESNPVLLCQPEGSDVRPTASGDPLLFSS